MKKKIMAALIMAALAVSAASCGNNETQTTSATTAATEATEAAETTTTAAETTAAEETETEAPETEAQPAETEELDPTSAKGMLFAAAGDNVVLGSDGILCVPAMTHEEYMAAEIDDPVVIQSFIQAKQSWWEDNGVGKASFYLQGGDTEESAYFLYNMPCTMEEYEQLVPGTPIRVYGFKAEWSGEVEIIDSQFEITQGYGLVTEPEDVTALLGTDELIDHQNEFVAFKGMTLEASADADGNEAAFLYSWDGSGEDGSDLYFNVSKDGQTFTFTVESYLCGPGTEVYEAVKTLNVGDVIDLEGFLYWYNGANPHITSVKAAE